MILQTDLLIVGSGIAGLFLARKTAEYFPDKKVTVITKNAPSESNTRYAQGGIASVYNTQSDSFEKHIKDTIIAGDWVCDEKVVEMVVRNSPEVLDELLRTGVEFDRDESGSYHLAKEGGHSEHRILHRKDQTGKEMEEKLLLAIHHLENIRIISHCTVLDLILEENKCIGVWAYQSLNNELIECYAGRVVLASGGAGQVYANTTNPAIATGDGIAMAYRAGVLISDMEFVQFHPTAFYQNNSEPTFLISEAVRGEGAILKNEKGDAFMENYHPLKDLAPRDVVSRAIHHEILKAKTRCVYLDCSIIGQETFAVHFPHIYQSCYQKGIIPGKDLIPVAPAAHYICGGIKTNIQGKTSIENLFACGECACTGMHGANRLASNSLLEAIVFARQIFEQIIGIDFPETFKKTVQKIELSQNLNTSNLNQILEIKSGIQQTMSVHAGIIKTYNSLQSADNQLKILSEKLNHLPKTLQWHEINNLLTIAQLILAQSIHRKENKGVFYNEDFVKRSNP